MSNNTENITTPTTWKHCPQCGSKKSCSWKTHRRVYVVEHYPTVLERRDFCPGDRDRVTSETRFFYVGQTRHRARKARRASAGSTFDCSCKTGACIKTPFRLWNKGNKFVRTYALKSGALRPEFFFHHTPVFGGKEAALDMKQHVAQELRDRGHLVHCDQRE